MRVNKVHHVTTINGVAKDLAAKTRTGYSTVVNAKH